MYMRLDGTVVGNIRTASFETNRFGKDVLKVEGTFDGTNATVLECPSWIGDQLMQIGVMGQDEGGVWVDNSKRVAIWKNKENGQTRWGCGDGAGLQTNMAAQQQRQSSSPPQQRPMTPRPAGAQSAPPPQQQQRPTNGQPAPQQRPQSQQSAPAEPADVTRRRIKATMLHCLKESSEIWANAVTAPFVPGIEVDSATLQATAATIFIAYSQRQIPLLADPQAPPPMTVEQKAALKEFRGICHRIGMTSNGITVLNVDAWFNSEISKHGQLSNLSADQAKKAIDAMAVLIANRENEIEKAKANYVPSADPPPPTFTGASEEIPF